MINKIFLFVFGGHNAWHRWAIYSFFAAIIMWLALGFNRFLFLSIIIGFFAMMLNDIIMELKEINEKS